MSSAPILLTTEDVSRLTGRGKQTLINDRFKGCGFPYVKIGKSIRYLRTDIEDFIRQNRVVPGKQIPGDRRGER